VATPCSDERTLASLRAAIDAVLERWTTRLRAALVTRDGDQGAVLAARFADAFPDDYTATTSIERAVEDVRLAAAAAASGTPQIALDPEPVDGATVLRVYLAGEPLVLADFLPLLDHAGLRALVEDRVRLDPAAGEPVFVHRFLVQDRARHPLDVARVGERLVALGLAVRAGRVPSDVLNRLVVETDLDWRAVDCLRAYAGYAVQAGLGARREVWRRSRTTPSRRGCSTRASPPASVRSTIPTHRRTSSRVSTLSHSSGRLCLRGLAALVQATVRTTFFAAGATSTGSCWGLRAADVPFLTTHARATKPTSARRASRASTCAPAWSRAGASGFPIVPTTSGPRCSGSCGRRR
jgi:glutamate dehydrogenase